MERNLGVIEDQMLHWLEQVVIGLNLCPFASFPFKDDRVRFSYCLSSERQLVIEKVFDELSLLKQDKEGKVETTLVVMPNALADFNDYLDCLYDINFLLAEEGYEGVFQVASFHPDYQFDGVSSSAVSNYTNRGPYPIFHLIRESSLSAVLDKYPNHEEIPARNVELMESMEERRLKSLFPWLYRGQEHGSTSEDQGNAN